MNTIGFAFIATVLVFILHPRAGYVRLSLNWPVQIYCLLFALYYVIPLAVMRVTGAVPTEDISTVLAVYCVALVALLIGSAAAWTRSTEPGVSVRLSDADSLALLTVGLLLVAGNIETIWWRISNGVFFTHARYYEQELTLAASFRDVFLTSLQLPLILLFGGCTFASHPRIAAFSQTVLRAYAIGLTAILALSSQTRPAATAIMFLWLGTVLYSARRLSLRSAVIACGAVLAVVFSIQTTRFMARERVADSENQLLAAAEGTLPSAVMSSGSYRDVLAKSADRAAGGALFLIDIVSGTERNGYLYWKVAANDLAMLIPRLLWPDKPAALPLQIFLQRSLGLFERDAPASPILQGYAAGGMVGVAAVHFLIGVLLWAGTRLRVIGPGWIVVVACVWGALVQVENDLVAGLIGAARNAAVLMLMFMACRLVCRDLISGRDSRLSIVKPTIGRMRSSGETA